jgi:metal-sulfur cluster biosynthetic enzyme
MAQDVQADLKANVLRALSTVTDPELDEPITDLGFVRTLEVSEDGRVSVDLVTSTFWCSPNFVYLMMEEARDVISKLPGIQEAHVTLGGHHDAPRINEGINSGKSFAECYGSEATGELGDLDRMIRTRALRSRLYSMAAALTRAGIPTEDLRDLSRSDIALDGESLVVKSRDRVFRVSQPADVQRVARYLSFLDGLGRTTGPVVVWDLDGNPPETAELASALSLGRLAKANFGLNAELCRALLSARMGRELSP